METIAEKFDEEMSKFHISLLRVPSSGLGCVVHFSSALLDLASIEMFLTDCLAHYSLEDSLSFTEVNPRWKEEYPKLSESQSSTFWKQLVENTEHLALPYDLQKRTEPDFVLPFNLGHMQSKIIEIQKDSGVSLMVFMLGCFHGFLSRLCDQEEVHTAYSHRLCPKPEFEHAIGNLTPLCWLRSRFEETESFGAFLKKFDELFATSFQHAPYYWQAHRQWREKQTDTQNLYQAHFQFINSTHQKIVPKFYFSEKWEIELCFFETNMNGVFKFNHSRFSRENGSRIVARWEHFMSQILTSSINETTLSKYTLLGQEDRKALFVMHERKVENFEPATIDATFIKIVAETPDKIAVFDDTQSLTYRELMNNALRVAELLSDFSLEPGDIVPLCADGCLELVVGMMGIVMAGAAYSPLLPSDPPQRRRFLLDDTRAKAVLVSEQYEQLFAEEKIKTHRVVIDKKAETTFKPTPRHDSNHLAYALYTSGSTGTPKCEIGRAVQQECRDRSRMPSSA
eukprot:TRINITY_DN5526_c1_g3_i3.p1 TRINITY_DN5526_c1_g3~~TRINITY_DN5526_c1_g3_i3.p1  ORF type:complete len:596 (-),score=46.75 TRINITY_DN5526_c1_g3_i3:18-1550(-)